MSILFAILIGLNVVLAYVIFAHHAKIEKMDGNQAIMMEYFDTIKKNEQMLKDDLQKLYHEFKRTEKESKKRPIGPQAKNAV